MTFGDNLRREAEFVLEDPIFQRSPVQARLLRYLVERALEGGPAPTQHEIAVDALGKPEDFDLANDSYPRVQVSRLRSSLDNYYSRQLPHDGHRLKIETGQYEVRLVPMEEIEPPHYPPAPPGAHRSASVREEAAPAAFATPSDPPGEAAATDGKKRRAPAFLVAPLALAGIMVAALVAWQMPAPETEPAADTLARPSVVLAAELTGLDGNGSADRDTARLAVGLAEILLAYSLVSTTQPAETGETSDYRLTLSFVHEPGAELQAFLSFTDADGANLFNELIEHDPDHPERLVEQIRFALDHIISPTGEIAQDRRGAFGDPLGSGYACFITIENSRAVGAEVADMVDTCIERHPQSEYAPFFRARRAFAAYNTARREGKPVEASGPAWQDLQAALEADPFNPFAQFVASKVLLAQDNCAAAQSSMRIASRHLSTYPRLRAAIDAEGAGCPGWDEEIGLSDEELHRMIATSPAPDPLHHFYMLVAAIASDDLESARLLAVRPQLRARSESELEVISMLHRALRDPAYARRNAQRLRADIARNVWGERTVDLVIENLTRAPQAAPDQAAGGAAG